ncbi:hypothetical protein F4813DRAFT_348170 [Daldinia decipiens]|uniref:uncharacterized protein n=1 Tax=Daldinia decipiens TaxID=326647 RepID=UPI0020C57057|nr:uncharacterized protein F4813DRAFT_348170 [Daldinia decipiens]KAI1660731.1 hypothetical protein F4813DRAFT_348170 [Daldinia decipiens]
MAEFCRIAQVAVRSTSLLRSSTSRWQPCSFSAVSTPLIPSIRHISTSPTLRENNAGNSSPKDSAPPARSPLARARYSSIWGDPFPKQNQGDDEIKKPNISVYDDHFAPEIDFETGELNKNKFQEERPAPPRPALRLVPRTGRTIHVTKNSDVARSFALLSIHVSSNRVRHDLNSQRYHERPGLKRKRLKSERWQRRFQKGFKACVKRVRELTKQGW